VHVATGVFTFVHAHQLCELDTHSAAAGHACSSSAQSDLCSHLQLLLVHRHKLCVDVWQQLLAACWFGALLAHAQWAVEVLIVARHRLQAYTGQVVHRTAAVTAKNIALQEF
jgi:hypothetical protein